MPDWTKSMKQTFEYYTVDPVTWQDLKKLTNVKSCSISRDSEAETLGSASFEITESVGECYIRVYLVTIQNGVEEKHPLGTFLVQTPTSSFDGKIRNVSMDAYTPLLELKENQPPIGYYIAKGTEVATAAYDIIKGNNNARAPVVKPGSSKTLPNDFVASTDDTWLSYLTDLLKTINYTFDLDEMGRILFTPIQDVTKMNPVWTYDDGNSSILYPELTMNHDLYGIPNVVEVSYYDDANKTTITLDEPVKNEDPSSPTSIQNRGRKITYRVIDPDLSGTPTKEYLKEYAEQLLSALSSIEYTITYTHGYCTTRVGDCVRLNYSKAGINDIKAKIISQSIKCEPGCPVTETAVFTTKLWR